MMHTYTLKDGTKIEITTQYDRVMCGDLMEHGITDATLRFVTESGSFERTVKTVVIEGHEDVPYHWDEIICEELICCEGLFRIELVDEMGNFVGIVLIPSDDHGP